MLAISQLLQTRSQLAYDYSEENRLWWFNVLATSESPPSDPDSDTGLVKSE